MRLTVVASVLLVALTACGGSKDAKADNGQTATTTPTGGTTSNDGPYRCDDVWKVGATLPSDYNGSCMEDADNVAMSGVAGCADGSKFSTYDDRFYAKLGGKVFGGPDGPDGQSDDALEAAYGKFYTECGG